MPDRKKPSIKFVNLHAHSTSGSPFDALGYPDEHMDFAFYNGLDAMALTDHGNMNGMAYQVLHSKKMKKLGKEFKPIYGFEGYFHPDLNEWLSLKEQALEDKKKSKEVENSDASGATYEDENATKNKKSNILNQRNHIVLLAQNQTGLNNLFSLVSKSFSQDYFYKFPRIDYKILEEHCEGVIASSACLTGDALVETSVGQITLKELVSRVKDKKEEIFILSFVEGEKQNSFEKVVWADKTRENAKLFKIRTKNGKELRLTGDHKVFTNNGWKRVDELDQKKDRIKSV